jgi:hypothetical protein
VSTNEAAERLRREIETWVKPQGAYERSMAALDEALAAAKAEGGRGAAERIQASFVVAFHHYSDGRSLVSQETIDAILDAEAPA